MAYRNNVSIIVGRKIETECEALRTQFSGVALGVLARFLDTKEVSADGTLVRYHHDSIVWPEYDPTGEFDGIHALERLVKDYCEADVDDSAPEGYAASFIRRGEEAGDVEDYGNGNLQWVDIVCDQFTTVYAVIHTTKHANGEPVTDGMGTVRYSKNDAVRALKDIAKHDCTKCNGSELHFLDDDTGVFMAHHLKNDGSTDTVFHYYKIVELKY